jgi:hypothetical protein
MTDILAGDLGKPPFERCLLKRCLKGYALAIYLGHLFEDTEKKIILNGGGEKLGRVETAGLISYIFPVVLSCIHHTSISCWDSSDSEKQYCQDF